MLCEWKGCDVEELNVQPDHIHLLVPFHLVLGFEPMGTLKGKLAIKLFKSYPQLKQNRIGAIIFGLWLFVNTVGPNEDMIRRYVQYQEGQDKRKAKSQNFTLFD